MKVVTSDNEHSSPDTHLIDVVGAAVAGQNKNGQGWIVSNNVFPSSWIPVQRSLHLLFEM